MKRFLSIVTAWVLLCGCSETFAPQLSGPENPLRPSGVKHPVRVSLEVIPSGIDVTTTRTVSERAIRDVNLYLFGPAGAVHTYCESTEPRFDCLPGDYRLYVLANLHTDAGTMNEQQIAAFALTQQDDYADLPMTAFAERVTIPQGCPSVRLPAVTAVRAVARIDYDIAVSPSLPDLDIRSVQAMSLPQQFHPFTSGGSGEYADGRPHADTSSRRRMRGTFYMLPNEQGTVARIVDQRQKNAANTPANATYLRIRARRGDKVLDYSVYLGQNNTSDFNIRPNTAHTLHITLRGDNESDARIRNYTVEVTADAGVQPQDGFYLEPLSASRLNIRLSGDFPDMGIYGIVRQIRGDRRAFLFDGRNPIAPLRISLRQAANSLPVVYEPDGFARDKARLQYRLTIYDKYGKVEDYDFTYQFARSLQVYLVWFGGPRIQYGTIAPAEALGVVYHDTLSSLYATVYCTDEGCRLRAIPQNGKQVECWASAANHAGILSYEEFYDFVPGTSPSPIFLYFR